MILASTRCMLCVYGPRSILKEPLRVAPRATPSSPVVRCLPSLTTGTPHSVGASISINNSVSSSTAAYSSIVSRVSRAALVRAFASAGPLAADATHATANKTMPTAGSAEASESTVPPEELWMEIVQAYERAQTSGACSKTDTQVEILPDAALGVDFVVRVASALKAKPQGPPAAKPATGASPAWRNPFLPPEPDLFVRQLGADHNLVLNKFNVVAHHVIITTKDFRSQAEPLYGGDLAAALEVLRAMPDGGVAFYNCGPHSGRSQPHKHLQVVPLPFAESQPPKAPVEILVATAAATNEASAALKPLQLRQLPYRCFAALLPDSPSPQELEAVFDSLLQLCHPGYSYAPAIPLDGAPLDAATAAAAAAGSVSYNVLMTRQWLMLVPRSAERCGPLALNSLAFAGTMLVRSEDELEYVRQTGPVNILTRIGESW